MLIPCCTTVLFLSNFFDFSSTAFQISLFLCSPVRRLTLAALDLSFKIEELLHKMAISFSELKVEQHNHSFLARWHDLPISSDPLLWFLSILSVHPCLSPTVPLRPLVGLRPASKFASFSHSFSFILSFRLTMPAVSLPAAVQNTTPEGVLSLCGCSLAVTLTTSIGIWHGAGATKSWSSVVSLSCSWRISLCIRSHYDSGGWATRIIHFSLWLFRTVSITLTRQETFSPAKRNYSFRLQMEGRLTFRDISPVVIRAKRLNLLQSTVHRIHSLAKSKALAVPER